MNFDLFTKYRAFREDDLLGSGGAYSACREVVWPACSDGVCHSQPEQTRRCRLKHKRVQLFLRPGCPGRSELTVLHAWSSCSSDVVYALQIAGTHPSYPFHLLSRFPKACELGTLVPTYQSRLLRIMEWPTTLCDLGMSGLDFVGSKAGIMLGVVGSLDLVLPLYYYRWGNGQSS